MIRPYRHSSSNAITDGLPKNDLPPLDPLLTLQVAMDHHTGSETPMGSASSRSSIASVCFAPSQGNYFRSVAGGKSNDPDNEEESDDSSSSSSEGGELQFQCRARLQSEARSASDPTRQARQKAASGSLLPGRFLASCHANGDCILWDLNQSKISQEQFIEPRGSGWMLRRLTDEGQFLYQTRDPRGTISIHAWENPSKPTVSFATYSQTFCSATPCRGHPNLLALPSANDSEATIRDLRMDPYSVPVAVFAGCGSQEGGQAETIDSPLTGRKHGMLTSLAFAESMPNNSTVSRPIVACGMESGTFFLHDLRMLGKQLPPSIKLSDDPVLALDMAPSAGGANPGCVAVAGMAGENFAQEELPPDEQGTVAILKGTVQGDQSLRLRLRSRLTTCKPKGEGKPGVNLCRFQPGDGRLFAVAGWDQRVRIMDRSSNSRKPLKAILRGHEASVSTFDWAPDSVSTGLCATAASDGRIHIWRCFSKS